MISIKKIGASGGVLILVMVFFLAFTIIGTSYLGLAALESRASLAQLQRAKAFLQAENALNLSLWRLNHGPDSLGTFSSDSLAASYDSVNYILRAWGNSSHYTCSLQVQLFKDHPFNHIVTYGSVLDTSNYYLSYISGHAITQISELPSIYTILNYYYSIADYRYEGNQDFSGTMPDGIHYVNGCVTMKNGTTLNGTLVVTDGVKFVGHVEIHAQRDPNDTTLYYPALVAGDTAQTESEILGDPLLVIRGAVYSTGAIIFKGKEISGPIIAPKVVLKSGVTVSDQGDPRYYQFPNGFGDPANFDWKKLVVKGSWRKLGT